MNTAYEKLSSTLKSKEPQLLPHLLPLFTEHLHLSEQDITDLLINIHNLKNDPRKLVIMGYLSGKDMTVPEVFYESLKTNGILESLKHLNCSLKVENIHLSFPKIKTFIAKYFKDYQIPISINMYITPTPEAPCFVPHCDFTEVFIYQLHGKKSWTFYSEKEKGFIFGRETKSILSEAAINEAIITKMILKPDDILAVPALMFHEASACEGASIHLTISLNRPRVEHLFQIIESVLLSEDDMSKYENLSNEEFEKFFEETFARLGTEEFKASFKKQKEQNLFLFRAAILSRGR